MRILKGTLQETRYETPTEADLVPPKTISKKTYPQGQVAYMADELGVHKISNPDPEQVAVSLHRKSHSPSPALRSPEDADYN